MPGKGFSLTENMNIISRFLAPRVTIDLNLDYVLFQKSETSFRLETYAFIIQEGENWRILSIGDPQILTEPGAIKAHLFQNDNALPKNHRYSLLVKFFQYGIIRCLKEAKKISANPIFKPVVTVRGLEKLDIFFGYQQIILENAIGSFAAEITFSDQEGSDIL